MLHELVSFTDEVKGLLDQGLPLVFEDDRIGKLVNKMKNYNGIISENESSLLVYLYISFRDTRFLDRYLSLSKRSDDYGIVSSGFYSDVARNTNSMGVEQTRQALEDYKFKIENVIYIRNTVLNLPKYKHVKQGDIAMYGEIERLFSGMSGFIDCSIQMIGTERLVYVSDMGEDNFDVSIYEEMNTPL